MTPYRWTHKLATAIALTAVGYQSALIWEMLDGVSLITKLGVPLATVSAAILPILAEAAWREGDRTKAFLLTLPVLVLMAYVLPSGISRLGEPQAARVSAATTSAADVSALRTDLARADKLVIQAQEWVATECKSGPGAKCRGVTYTLNQRQAYQRELSNRLAQTRIVHTPWLPAWQPALLPIGLELAILSLLFYGFGPLTKVSVATSEKQSSEPETGETVHSNVVPIRIEPKVSPIQAITERDFRDDPITDEEIEELKRLIGLNGVNNKTLAGKLECSEGQASKIVSAAVEAGTLARQKIGREVRISVLH